LPDKQKQIFYGASPEQIKRIKERGAWDNFRKGLEDAVRYNRQAAIYNRQADIHDWAVSGKNQVKDFLVQCSGYRGLTEFASADEAVEYLEATLDSIPCILPGGGAAAGGAKAALRASLRAAKAHAKANRFAEAKNTLANALDEAKRLQSSTQVGSRGPVARATTNIETHHLLPREFRAQFERAGLNIEDYKLELSRSDHRLLPEGLHTGSNNWNSQWRRFFQENPSPTRDQILRALENMKRRFGID
jgi:hypothetical protein